MSRTDEAILLNKHRLGEADLILVFLAENTGLIRGVARSALKSRKRFGGTLEPLSRVRLRWSERTGRDLHRIDAMDLLTSYAGMQADPRIQASCGLISEIAAALAGADDPDPRYFRLMCVCLDGLRDGLDPWVCIRYFELWSLRLHGMLPDLETCGRCRRSHEEQAVWVVSDHAAILCSACGASSSGGTRTISPEMLSFLRTALRHPPEMLAEYAERCRPGRGLERFLRNSLERFAERKFKCYRHLDPGMTGRCG